MNRRILIAALAASLPLTIAFAPTRARAADPMVISVYAAPSLREAFYSAANAFTKKTGIVVIFDFAGSDQLASRILLGAPGSVFAPGNFLQMGRLHGAGLTFAPEVLAHNRLVAITPAGGSKQIGSLADFARSGVGVVLAVPSNPVGAYARAAFAKMNGRAGYARDFANAVEKNVVAYEPDVKAVVEKVVRGEGDAGIVYMTDITPEVAPKVRVIALPPESLVVATYPIAVLKSAPDPAAARAFVDFIRHDGQRYLKDRGFIMP